METVDGIVLSDLVLGVEEAVSQGKQQEIRHAIMDICGDLSRWNREIQAKEMELDELKRRQQETIVIVYRLRQGEWAALFDLPTTRRFNDTHTETT